MTGLITNPTHVAVALKFDQGSMASPAVLAKGYDEGAQKIKAIVAEHNIPMVENIQCPGIGARGADRAADQDEMV